MTNVKAPELTADAVLARLDDTLTAERRVAADKLAAVLDWVAIHSEASLVPPSFRWQEQPEATGGEGAPQVAEFALTELAPVLGMSREAAQRYVGNAVELRYRLPRLHHRVTELEVPVWRALRIAEHTRLLPPAGAAWVDRQVVESADKIGPARLERLVQAALAEFDPDQLEADRLTAMEQRHATVNTGNVNGGCVDFTASLDLADGLDLDAALALGAAELANHGSHDPLDVRRSRALAQMARDKLTGTLTEPTPEDPTEDPTASSSSSPEATNEPGGVSRRRATAGTPKSREVVLHVHLSAEAVAAGFAKPTSHTVLAEVEKPAALVAIDQVAAWCTNPDTKVTIRPVVDLNDAKSVPGYRVPDRFKDELAVRDRTCVFPHCNRSARHTDADHVVPWDAGGPTSTTNLAPLCRSHHRAKTTGGWRYTMLTPGTYEWTSPRGTRWLVDPRGTERLGTPP